MTGPPAPGSAGGIDDLHARGGAHLLVGEGRGSDQMVERLLRAALGAGRRVFAVRFVAGRAPPAERELAARSGGRLEVRVMGREAAVRSGERDPVDVKWAEDGLALGRRALHKGGWDLVILAEVTRALALGLLDLDRVLELIDERPERTVLVLSGPDPPAELCDAVDSIRGGLPEATP
jgi:ATP:corrinoid adenosyltransferase